MGLCLPVGERRDMKKIWEVKRVVVEYHQVAAETRQEAKDKAEDPYSIEVKSVTAIRLDTSSLKNGLSRF